MVARINTGKSVSKALNYNEKKVELGVAELLLASGFIKEADNMNFYEKLQRFQSLTSLNQRTSTNTLHVSLNFHPSEKLSNGQMMKIADAYMQKIGFGAQPYLVYRHEDAGHPHIHIVSVNIQRDGSRISMHKMGERQSEKARKEIEHDFNLVKASDHSLKKTKEIVTVDLTKAQYGKTETRRTIANILTGVISQYKCSSLHELNVILGQFNIRADRGEAGSRLAKYRGLIFFVLDDKGNKVGIPIKASNLPGKPTLNTLEKLFKSNQLKKMQYKKRLATIVAWVLNNQPRDLKSFIDEMKKNNIVVVLHRGKNAVIYGITFIDNNQKCVFNGSDLGREFSVNAIIRKCRSQKVIEIRHCQKIKNGTITPHVRHPSLHNKENWILLFDQMKSAFSIELPKAIDGKNDAIDVGQTTNSRKRKKRRRKSI